MKTLTSSPIPAPSCALFDSPEPLGFLDLRCQRLKLAPLPTGWFDVSHVMDMADMADLYAGWWLGHPSEKY